MLQPYNMKRSEFLLRLALENKFAVVKEDNIRVEYVPDVPDDKVSGLYNHTIN